MGVRIELAAKVDMNVLRWFGHVERMDDERLLKKVMLNCEMLMVLSETALGIARGA
ncbi:hypothetical protein SK128_002683 [Halocaridina rubra]|uniref:Uncharacterized protein n=1 Tax=Halocaridina rubra TaxID=373956 RepID=A0AAN9A398_HALRR